MILNGYKKNYIQSASANPPENQSKKFEELGIVGLSSFCIIQVAEIIDQHKKKVRLIKMRNPSQNSKDVEWTGAWSDED